MGGRRPCSKRGRLVQLLLWQSGSSAGAVGDPSVRLTDRLTRPPHYGISVAGASTSALGWTPFACGSSAVAAPSCTESCSELSSVVSAGAVTCDGASGPAAAAGAVSVLGFGVTPPPPCPTAELRRSNGAFDDTLSRRSANERGARGHDSQLAVACSPDRLLLIRSVCVRRLLVVQGEGGREGRLEQLTCGESFEEQLPEHWINETERAICLRCHFEELSTDTAQSKDV